MLTLNYGHGDDVVFDADDYEVDEYGDLIMLLDDGSEIGRVVGFSTFPGASVIVDRDDELTPEEIEDVREMLEDEVASAVDDLHEATEALINFNAEYRADDDAE